LSNFLFKKTLIIGLGLIGGSFAKALRQNQVSLEIFGCDLDPKTLEMAQEQGAIDGVTFLEDDISNFDFIVVAAPLSTYEKIFEKLKNKISSDAIVMDLGSIKNLKIKDLPKNFIPCHPIAGSENSGFEHALANLFSGKKFIICSENSARNKIVEVAKKIGAEVEFMDAKSHDEIFALVSHLPQFLSFLTAEFSPKKIEDEFFKTAFRLDNSSPEIWEDVFKMNEKNLEKFYLQFFDELEKAIKNLMAGKLKFDANLWTGSGDPVQQELNPVQQELDPIQQELETIRQELNPVQQELEPVQQEEKIIHSQPSSLAHSGEDLMSSSSNLTKSLMLHIKDDDVFFTRIFFRALVAQSFLKIPQIKIFQKHAGQGFSDFTSIVEVLNFDAHLLADLAKKNQQKILKIFQSIS